MVVSGPFRAEHSWLWKGTLTLIGHEGVCRPRSNLQAFQGRKVSAPAGNVTPSLFCCPTLSLVSVVTDPMWSGLLCCKRVYSGWLLWARKLTSDSIKGAEFLDVLWVSELFKYLAIPNLLTVYTVLISWLSDSQGKTRACQIAIVVKTFDSCYVPKSVIVTLNLFAVVEIWAKVAWCIWGIISLIAVFNLIVSNMAASPCKHSS